MQRCITLFFVYKFPYILIYNWNCRRHILLLHYGFRFVCQVLFSVKTSQLFELVFTLFWHLKFVDCVFRCFSSPQSYILTKSQNRWLVLSSHLPLQPWLRFMCLSSILCDLHISQCFCHQYYVICVYHNVPVSNTVDLQYHTVHVINTMWSEYIVYVLQPIQMLVDWINLSYMGYAVTASITVIIF